MAEFSDVMRQAKRMCEAHSECDNCPVRDVIGTVGCPFLEAYIDRAGQIERIVMDWAANHPEPKYPTWAEWQKANFPDALHSICPNYFMAKKPLGTCAAPCGRCTDTPIPADIAEKLGIKPIGGKENA